MARPKDVHAHRAPADCPVCGDHLSVTRLGCGSCGSELGGVFAPCEYCALDDADSELLRVFLSARGNMREVEKHLGVSYPTARARFTSLLQRVGLVESEASDGSADRRPHPGRADPAAPGEQSTRDEVLADVASGRLSAADAAALLADLR